MIMKHCSMFPSKKRYATKKDAETAILLINNVELRIYFCTTCGGWHLTSKNNI